MKTNLQSLLENRLRLQLSSVGSTKLKMTWKHQVTPQGRRYLQLACSVHPTQDADFTGEGFVQKFWGTPIVSDAHGGCRWALKEGDLDNYNHTIKNEYLAANAFGNTERGKKVQMGSPLCLNPEISRWLMGFPTEFSNIVDMVMPLFRK